ncbi:glycerol-3-phosphate dehydrogenase [Ahniella affigens]|uniref:Glycerol-3-phosphate dehydrogenase [NAD(P)+] n=1 Tax=Ahniella affigens TaxID=2021234 RepID=A0A2P1PLL7_9GAMM|nr:NAD(P)H-dependent glycerol-3-phosphate dehydrogenase [Ahniella affigens]AVP95722.1 glycerol-3-phosphate dehydrogenase [Ahniella affigens]
MPLNARVAVLGAGSWGTALAMVLARHGVRTTLWGRDTAAMAAMAEARCNARYLPDSLFPDGLAVTADLNSALSDADDWLLVTPSHAFREVLEHACATGHRPNGLSWATKGFEPGTGRFLHEVAEDIVGRYLPLAIVTGPSFAKEVAAGLPTAVTVHSEHEPYADQVAKRLHGPGFRAYTGNDVIGAELGGAMKNVLAVATGVADGMKLGLNARAGMITRGLNEMIRVCHALGGRPETLMGLAGVGDLVLTCTGDLSRNRRLGLALGRGIPLSQAVKEIGQVVESVQTANEVMRIAEKHGLDLPITEQVSRVLNEEITPAEGLKALLAREQKPEYPPGLFGS